MESLGEARSRRTLETGDQREQLAQGGERVRVLICRPGGDHQIPPGTEKKIT
jgi:hypothetical protein